MKQTIQNYIQAAYPGLALQTVEEPRAVAVLLDVAKSRGLNLHTWDALSGVQNLHRAEDNNFTIEIDADDGRMPGPTAQACLSSILTSEDTPGIVAFLDLHTWASMIDPETERAFKDLLRTASTRGLFVVFLGLPFKLPGSFERMMPVRDFDLPDRDALDKILEQVEEACSANDIALEGLDNGEREAVLRAATGLTAPEAENAYALAVIEAANPDDTKASRKVCARTVYREKAAAVKRSGLMELIEPDARGLDGIGGMVNLKKWMQTRRNAYTTKAKKFGLPTPRGVMLCGVPGTGKSLAAKCIGTVLNAPTLKWDIGRTLGGIVGESEANIRAALALADAIAPCVLWVDEIEKALAGSSGNGSLDSGVGKRLLGTLLTWQQEHKSDVFVFATANQVNQLPPELLRRGRFDEIFFLDLPTEEEREEIVSIHLIKVNRDPKKFDTRKIAKACDLFTGSEIEEVVRSGLFAAFDAGREIKTLDIIKASKETVPLAKSMREQIAAIRDFGEKRCRRANGKATDKGEQFRRLMGGISA